MSYIRDDMLFIWSVKKLWIYMCTVNWFIIRAVNDLALFVPSCCLNPCSVFVNLNKVPMKFSLKMSTTILNVVHKMLVISLRLRVSTLSVVKFHQTSMTILNDVIQSKRICTWMKDKQKKSKPGFLFVFVTDNPDNRYDCDTLSFTN